MPEVIDLIIIAHGRHNAQIIIYLQSNATSQNVSTDHKEIALE